MMSKIFPLSILFNKINGFITHQLHIQIIHIFKVTKIMMLIISILNKIKKKIKNFSIFKTIKKSFSIMQN